MREPRCIDWLVMFLEFLLEVREQNERFGTADKHSHQCGECKHLWTHGHENMNDREAHLCPSCGAGPYWWWANSPKGGDS